MKKTLIFVLISILVISCIMLVACSDNEPINTLSYGIKYLNQNYLNGNNEVYYTFYENGTGIYRYHYDFDDGDITSYTVTFKYVSDSANEVVYCFYDTLEYDATHNYGGISSTWTSVLNFNENFLLRIDSSAVMYISEEYLASTLTNFGK